MNKQINMINQQQLGIAVILIKNPLVQWMKNELETGHPKIKCYGPKRPNNSDPN